MRAVVEILTLLPLVFPPVVLVVGVSDSLGWMKSNFHGWSISFINNHLLSENVPLILVFLYMMLSLPFVFRALDAGIRSIDSRTLVEASRNLGAGWFTDAVPGADAVPAHGDRQRHLPVLRAGDGRVHDRQRSCCSHPFPVWLGNLPTTSGQVQAATSVLSLVHRRGPAADHRRGQRPPNLASEGLIHDDRREDLAVRPIVR